MTVNALLLWLAVDFVWFGYFTSFDKLKLDVGICKFRVAWLQASYQGPGPHPHSCNHACFPCQHFVPVLSLGVAPAEGRVSILGCSLCPACPPWCQCQPSHGVCPGFCWKTAPRAELARAGGLCSLQSKEQTLGKLLLLAAAQLLSTPATLEERADFPQEESYPEIELAALGPLPLL